MEDLEADIARLLETGDLPAAASAIMRGYGPAVLGYLLGLARDEDRADDVFSQFCEDLWRGLPGFRRDSSSRTWVYTLAWHAWLRQERDAYRRHGRPLASEEMSRLAAEVRSTTALHLKTEVKDAVARLREQLSPAEQSLLVLRVDRELSWSEVAAVMSTPEEPLDPRTATKRFQRVKDKLRTLAEDAGLLERRESSAASLSQRGCRFDPDRWTITESAWAGPERDGSNRAQTSPVACMNTPVCSLRRHVPSEQASPGAQSTTSVPVSVGMPFAAGSKGPAAVAGVDVSHRRRPVSAEQQRRHCT